MRGSVPGAIDTNARVGCHSLLEGIFPTQGSNPGLLHCRWILYHLSHQGSPQMWEKLTLEESHELGMRTVSMKMPSNVNKLNGWTKQPLTKFLLYVRPGALRGGCLRRRKWWAKRLEDRCIKEWEWNRRFWARKQWEQVLKYSSGWLCLIDQGVWIRDENWNIYLG